MRNPIRLMWITLAAALIIAAGINCAGSQQASQPTTATRPAATPAAARPAAPAASASAAQTAPAAKTAATHDELDIAIRDASDCLNDNIPKGSKIVILNIESNFTNLSEYIIDELIANAVNDKNFSVVDRRQLEAIQSEQKFQMSGAVDDKDALAIGKFFGAQTIISGAMREMGGRYRMTVRALSVQTAVVQSQCNQNITTANSATLTDLANSGGGRPIGATTSGTATTASGGTTQTASTPAAALSAAVESADVAGALNVSNVSAWNTAINKIRNGGNNQTHIINVNGNVAVPALPKDEPLFGTVTGITVTIQGNGTLSPSSNGNLLLIGTRQTVIVKDVTLRGRSDNNSRLVTVMSESVFRMEGKASVTGNTESGGVYVSGNANFIMQDNASVSGNSSSSGGGVSVASGGTFIMRGGSITGNRAINRLNRYDTGIGGGVYVGGTFTMEGGSITGNTATGAHQGGGGVYVSGTFTMKGGSISGNTCTKVGGGVYVLRASNAGTFTKTGGIIHGGDSSLGDRNTASKQGHVVYFGQSHAVYADSSSPTWRNATAGPDDGTGGYGFYLND